MVEEVQKKYEAAREELWEKYKVERDEWWRKLKEEPLEYSEWMRKFDASNKRSW